MIGRFCGTFGLIGLIALVCRHKPTVSCKELTYIWYAGLIRGAIAFGLVLRLPYDVPERSVIVTTSLSLVVLTTVLFGSTMPLLSRCLLKKDPTIVFDEEPTSSLKEGLLNESNNSHHNFIKHPNEESDTEGESALLHTKAPNRGFKHYWKRFDDYVMKPLLIHNYSKMAAKKEYEFFEAFEKDAVKMEDDYVDAQAEHGNRLEKIEGLLNNMKLTKQITKR